MKCGNCGQEKPGNDYSFYYGKYTGHDVETSKWGGGMSGGVGGWSSKTTTTYEMEGTRSVFICDECADRFCPPLRKRALFLLPMLFGLLLCMLSSTLDSDALFSFGLAAGLVGIGVSIALLLPRMWPTLKLEMKRRRNQRGLEIRTRQQTLERFAMELADPGEEYTCFTTKEYQKLKPSQPSEDIE